MSAVIAHGSIVGGDSPWMLIWFGLVVVGIIFIAWAMRDENRNREQGDDAVPDLQDRRDLPWPSDVRNAVRPKPTARSPASTDGPRPRAVPGPRGPRGLVR